MTYKMIDPRVVVIPSDHRSIKPSLQKQIDQSVSDHGFNVAYPIVLDDDESTLVEGAHRLRAAIAHGIPKVPYIVKPSDVGRIRYGLQCNADGQLTAADDVFDLAELCWNLANQEWTGAQIAKEIGWNSTPAVTNHKNIKTLLHPIAWNTARWGLSKNPTLDNPDNGTVDNELLSIDKWAETHFRSILQHVPCPNGDRAMMRAQIATIVELMGKPDKLTAKRAGEIAERNAWYTHLAKRMRDELVDDVSLSDRKSLLRNVRNGVFGKAHSETNEVKFSNAIDALNKNVLRVTLYHDDAFQRIPQIQDKSINLLVTDPPYNTTSHEWDKIGTGQEFVDWFSEWLGLVRPKLAEDYHIFVFCDPDYMADVEMILRHGGWPIKSRIIWEYRNLVKGRDVADKFIENYQVCFHCGTHNLNWWPNWDDRRFMVQQHATPQSNFTEGKHHPTAKPVSLIKTLVEVGSKPGDVVLDIFAGGGTTGEACISAGQRACILIEQSDEYCSVIENRLSIKREE